MKKRLSSENLLIFILFIVITIEIFNCYNNKNKEYIIHYQNAFQNIFLTSSENRVSEEDILKGLSNKEIYNYFVKNQKYIMHAGGSIDGHTYTNSREVLSTNYFYGNRIFEIDLNFTSDGELALLHGWEQYDYTHRLGISPTDNLVMDKNTWKQTLLYGQYHTMTIDDLIEFMKTHPYAYFILNLKGGSKAAVSKKGIKQIVKKANYDKTILNRFIIWGYNPDVIKIARNIFDFELVTISYKDPNYMRKIINTKTKFINYCINNKISSIIVSTSSVDDEIIKMAKENNIDYFVFTVDNEKKANEYLNRGVSMVLSNRLVN